MYDELVKRLRNCATEAAPCRTCDLAEDGSCFDTMMKQAAYAIEELTAFVQEAERDRDEYRERLDKANDAVEELANKLCDWCGVCPKERRRPFDCECLH